MITPMAKRALWRTLARVLGKLVSGLGEDPRRGLRRRHHLAKESRGSGTPAEEGRGTRDKQWAPAERPGSCGGLLSRRRRRAGAPRPRRSRWRPVHQLSKIDLPARHDVLAALRGKLLRLASPAVRHIASLWPAVGSCRGPCQAPAVSSQPGSTRRELFTSGDKPFPTRLRLRSRQRRPVIRRLKSGGGHPRFNSFRAKAVQRTTPFFGLAAFLKPLTTYLALLPQGSFVKSKIGA